MTWLYYALLVIGGYLFGSLSPALLISHTAWGIDIRKHGSHNAGTTNMLRVMGWRYGVLTFLLDLAKGVLPTLIGLWTGLPYAAYAAGAAATLGHAFPVFSQFKGGKCVTTGTGVLLVLNPLFTGCALAVGLAICFITRIVSIGSLGTYLLVVIAAFAIPDIPLPFALMTLGIAVLIFWRHRENIGRLIRGEEKKLVISRGHKEDVPEEKKDE